MFVPTEIVATQEEMVGFGKSSEEVGLGEVKAVRSGMGGGPFHLVFGDEHPALI